MDKNNTGFSMKVFVLVAYIFMMTINILANALPINGIYTYEVSEKYNNMFTPISMTFSIWGVIYILLTMLVLYYSGLFRRKDPKPDPGMMNKLGRWFGISSILNGTWLLAWHYGLILLSVILIVALLICLIILRRIVSKLELSKLGHVFVNLPISLYFGWITIATTANIIIYLVSINWNRFGMADSFWTALVVILGMIIGTMIIISYNDFVYGLVFIWSYMGILLRYIGTGSEPQLVSVLVLCIALFVISDIYIVIIDRYQHRWLL